MKVNEEAQAEALSTVILILQALSRELEKEPINSENIKAISTAFSALNGTLGFF